MATERIGQFRTLGGGGSSDEENEKGGFFSSPEFLSQIGSQLQDISRRGSANKLAQVALATAPFSGSSNALLEQAKAGIGEGFDAVGSTLKSKAIRDLRLRAKRESKEREKLIELLREGRVNRAEKKDRSILSNRNQSARDSFSLDEE